MKNISFEHEHLNHHHSQDDYELGIYEDGEVMGYVDYTIFQNEITISDILVRPNRRREGFGSMLVKKMKELHPESTYRPSMKTELGAKFIHKDVNLKEELKRIKNLLISEQRTNDLIIKAGTELFHGTIEGYDKRNLRVGGYDKIFWTTRYPNISQTYIPTSGVKIFTSTSHIVNPSENIDIQNFQRSIGINYDYSKVTFNRQSRYSVDSFVEAPIFQKISDRYWNLRDLAFKKYQEGQEIKKKLDNETLPYEEENELLKKWGELEDEEEKIRKEINKLDKDKIKNQYVNLKLTKLGYEPTNKHDYNFDYSWRLKIENDNIAPAEFRAKGRLLIIKPKRDLKIFDTTSSEQREPDLTDVDYHKHGWFEAALNAGYDGIKISDFAQSENMGNVGHYSIGLFQSTLKDVTADEVKAVHHDLDFSTEDNNTPEYHSYKQKIQEEIIRIQELLK